MGCIESSSRRRNDGRTGVRRYRYRCKPRFVISNEIQIVMWSRWSDLIPSSSETCPDLGGSVLASARECSQRGASPRNDHPSPPTHPWYDDVIASVVTRGSTLAPPPAACLVGILAPRSSWLCAGNCFRYRASVHQDREQSFRQRLPTRLKNSCAMCDRTILPKPPKPIPPHSTQYSSHKLSPEPTCDASPGSRSHTPPLLITAKLGSKTEAYPFRIAL